jgi:hypothetical protein
MNKKISFFSIILALMISSMACQISINTGGNNQVTGSGNVVQEERPISGVTAVTVANQGDLQIELGDEERLVIEAEDNLMEYLKSDVRNGRLILETRPSVNLRNTKPIRYTLTVKLLEGLSTSSSGNINAPTLEGELLTIESSSSGDINLEGVNADILDVGLSSSGDVTIGSGAVTKQTVRVSSSGNYDAQSLQSQEADVWLSSSGDAYLSVSEILNGTLSSSGNLYYWGDPDVNVKTSSSGEAIDQD